MGETMNARRLFRNTGYMYLRMAFLFGVSFYASRVLLQQLGVDDFGIYNVVGSIIALFASLRVLFASSTQRFLNFESGLGHDDMLGVIFSMSICVNVILALLMSVVTEAVGLWFINTKMNVDPSRLVAARWVLHFSVLASVVSILTTPYDAVIISRENMRFFAAVSMLEGALKLVVVFMLSLAEWDKLIVYSAFILLVSVLVRMIYLLYCRKRYPESRFRFCWDPCVFRRMFSFAGWNFLGNSAFFVSQNGLNMVLNVFGGTVVNAARGIAYQLYSALLQCISSTSVAVAPYLVKTFAKDGNSASFRIAYSISKVQFSLMLSAVTILFVLAESILSLWLGDVPQYAVVFTKLTILNLLFRALHDPVDTIFNASGDLKIYQIVESCILMLPLLTSYMLLKGGCSFELPFVMVILFEVVNLIVIIGILKRQCIFPIPDYLRNVILPCFLSSIPSILVCVSGEIFGMRMLIRIVLVMLSIAFQLVIMYCSGLSAEEKSVLKSVFGKCVR